MEKVWKTKKACLIGIIALVIVAIAAVGIYFATRKEEPKPENTSTRKEEIHTMIVKINPTVKLTFQTTFQECTGDDGKKYICSYEEQEVTDYELINDDAKEVYRDLDFKGMDIYKTVAVLCDTAREHDIGFQSVEITSDWTDLSKEEEVIQKIQKESKYETNFTVTLKIDEYAEDYDPNEKTYDVTFDSDGGSKVATMVTKEGKPIKKPTDPTKDGYEFVAWYLDQEKFDFTKDITENITLKAKWKKVEETTSTSSSSSTAEEQITKKLYVYGYPEIVNQSDDIIAEGDLDRRYEFEVTITGPKSIVNAMQSKSIQLSVDVKGQTIGTKELSVKVDTGKEGVTASVTPAKVPVIIKKGLSSTVDKINLNDNILVSIYPGGTICGYHFYATNAKEVYGDLLQDNYIRESISESGESNLVSIDVSKLKYDEAKERAATTKLQELAKGKNPGVSIRFMNVEGHQIDFQYRMLYISGYGNFSTKYDNRLEEFRNKYKEAIQGAITIAGPCGGGEDGILLDEELCAEYNLTCSRW